MIDNCGTVHNLLVSLHSRGKKYLSLKQYVLYDVSYFQTNKQNAVLKVFHEISITVEEIEFATCT